MLQDLDKIHQAISQLANNLTALEQLCWDTHENSTDALRTIQNTRQELFTITQATLYSPTTPLQFD